METTMTREDRHSAIGFGGAYGRQLRFLWISRRPLLLMVALLAVLVLAGEPWVQDPKMRLFVMWPVWVVIAPIAWSFAVFFNEGPSSRLYFWSQPVDRTQQTLARIAAGVTWLWVAIVLLILVGWTVAAVDGNAWQMAEIGPAGWVGFFTGSLLVYLAVSLLTIPSDYPIRWFFGLLFLFPLLVSLFSEWLEWDPVMETVLEPLANQTWGLAITIVGGLGYAVNGLQNTINTMRDPSFVAVAPAGADVAAWWWATPAWIVVLGALVVFIASRHPDTLPKLRWFRLRR